MGYVTSIHFNKNDFPLSPCMDSYGIYDSPDAFIIEANGDHSLLDVFEVSVGADVTAKTLTLGGEAYSIRVYREGSDLDPVICFGMVNEETQEEEKTFKMQQLEF